MLGHRLRQRATSGTTWPLYVGVIWRGSLLGTVLFLVLTDDPVRNLRYNLISYIVALVWCYYDGVRARGRWSVAWYEGLWLHLIGIVVAKGLILIFGSPL
jgi:hypothetical protein